MSRHSRGAESAAPRRFRRRGEEPSIMEWLESGSYGPYAAEANRAASEESVGTELPAASEPLPPPVSEPPATYGTSSYDTGSFGASAYGTAAADVSASYNGSYGASSYGTGSESLAAYGGSYGAVAAGESSAAYGGSYGAVAAGESSASYGGSYGTASEGESPASYGGSYGAAPAGESFGATSYGGAGESPASYGAVSAGESSASYGGSYGAASAGESFQAASYGTAADSQGGSYGTAYGGANGSASADESSPYNGSHGTIPFGAASALEPSRYRSPDSYGTGQAASYNGSYDASRYGDEARSGYAAQSTVDPSTYGAHASAPAVSTQDSPAPAYGRPEERYRSIADPSRPAPGEYGFRTTPPIDPPMADYLVARTPIQDPPAPVRRPTTPIPSAARSRKAPKEPPPAPANVAGRLRMRVNPIACDGHGLCAELLPEIVSLDDWGYPMPVVAEVPAELEAHAERAAQQCPTLAIILERRQPRPT